jgi:hypothetical protein
MKYRVTVMLPTEMYIDADSMEEAKGSIDWLLENYPQIDAPMSSATDTTMKVAPKIMTVEEQLEYDAAEGC